MLPKLELVDVALWLNKHLHCGLVMRKIAPVYWPVDKRVYSYFAKAYCIWLTCTILRSVVNMLLNPVWILLACVFSLITCTPLCLTLSYRTWHYAKFERLQKRLAPESAAISVTSDHCEFRFTWCTTLADDRWPGQPLQSLHSFFSSKHCPMSIWYSYKIRL